MKNCKHCGEKNPDEAMFCAACGRPLSESRGEAKEARSAQKTAQQKAEPVSEREKSPGVRQEERKIGFELTFEDGSVMERSLGLDEELTLGREDFLRFVPQEQAKFISQEHVKLSRTSELADAIQVEDMDSTNGTKLEGTELKAGHPKPLSHGNELDLAGGSVTLSFLLKKSSSQAAESEQEVGEPEPAGAGTDRDQQPRCPNCGWYNLPGASQCEQCGEPL